MNIYYDFCKKYFYVIFLINFEINKNYFSLIKMKYTSINYIFNKNIMYIFLQIIWNLIKTKTLIYYNYIY